MRKILGYFVFYWGYRRVEPSGVTGRVWGVSIGNALFWYVALDRKQGEV